MTKCRILKCRSKYCSNQVTVRNGNINKANFYCVSCKKEHEIKVLELQYNHDMLIKELLMYVANMFNFKSISAMSDYLESHIFYVRFWIKKYYGMDWDEFKQSYFCKTNDCIRIKGDNFKNKYYIVNKLKHKDVCSCASKSGYILALPKTQEDRDIVNSILTIN